MAAPNHSQNRNQHFHHLLDHLEDVDNLAGYRQQSRDFVLAGRVDTPSARHVQVVLPSRKDFISNQLKVLVLAELGSEDRTCDICYVVFGTSEDKYQPAEEAVRLPCCGKVVGKACVKHWFHIRNTCPNCRKELFLAAVDIRALQEAQRDGQLRRIQELRERRSALEVEQRRLARAVDAHGRSTPPPERRSGRDQNSAPVPEQLMGSVVPPPGFDPYRPPELRGLLPPTPSINGDALVAQQNGRFSNLYSRNDPYSDLSTRPFAPTIESASVRSTAQVAGPYPPSHGSSPSREFYGAPGYRGPDGFNIFGPAFPNFPWPGHASGVPIGNPVRDSTAGTSRPGPSMTLPPAPTSSFGQSQQRHFNSNTLRSPRWQPESASPEGAQPGMLVSNVAAQSQASNPDPGAVGWYGVQTTGSSVEGPFSSNRQSRQTRAPFPPSSGDSSRANGLRRPRAAGSSSFVYEQQQF